MDNAIKKPTDDFFIVRFRGGLGNQLFQYSAAKIYLLTTGRPFKADVTGYANPEKHKVVRGYKLKNFNINLPIADGSEIRRYKYPYGILSKIWRGVKTKIFKLDYLDYHPELFKKHINYLDGYFQSPLYYAGYESVIRTDCALRPEILSDKAKSTESLMRKTVSVAVHIRRGDLVTQLDAQNSQGVCSVEYYSKALGYIHAKLTLPYTETSESLTKSPKEELPHFFVFSDDINWVKANIQFPTPAPVIFVSELGLEDYEELYLMSTAKHNIIGNSTFSWWGAWLNTNPNKIVAAPKSWSLNTDEHPTIIPEDWLRF